MTLTRVKQAQTRLRAVEVRHENARQYLRDTVREARSKHTLAEIGQVLGMTRQAVYELLKR